MPLRWAPGELEAAAVTEAGTGRVPGETNFYGNAERKEGLFSFSKGNRIELSFVFVTDRCSLLFIVI